MPKTKISEFSATPGNNTDIDGINLAEGCAPSGINDAIRELMAQLKDFQAGTAGDSFNGPVGTTTPAAGAFTSLSASGTFALTGDQVQISEGGTGQTTANAAFNALAPSQATHAGKYLKTDGTNTSWDALDISTADITGTLPVANGGTGVTSSTGTGSVVLSASPTFTGTVNGASLTLSSNFTLSGGTANGVAYLNGSKVLTTGSALTFDGTTLTLTGNGSFKSDFSGNGLIVSKTNVGPVNAIRSVVNTSDVLLINDSASGFTNTAFYSAGSEAMRLTSVGLGIGTSSPISGAGVTIGNDGSGSATVKLAFSTTSSERASVSMNGGSGEMRLTSGYAGYGGFMTFHTNDLERARITSGGDLLVGATSASATAGSGFKVVDSATTPSIRCVGANSTASFSTYEVYSTGVAAYRFYVDYAGTIFATSTTISAISDRRFKENIVDLDAGLDAVMALKPRKFDWKDGKGKNIKGDRGFIAQEFEQVFPDLIDEWKDPAPEGEEPYKSVRQDLIPVLVKAIQEQQVIINDLRARVAALETK